MNLGTGPLSEGVHQTTAQDCFAFIRQNTRPDEVGIFSRCRALTLFTGRPAATYHKAPDDAHLWDYFDSIGARYVVVNVSREAGFSRDRAYLLPFVQRYPHRFQQVYANPDLRVFRIISVAERLDERRAHGQMIAGES